MVSVEYRLSPEHPYPAAYHDVVDFAGWLVENGKKEVIFIAGQALRM